MKQKFNLSECVENILNELTYNDFRNINFELYPGVRVTRWDKFVNRIKSDFRSNDKVLIGKAVNAFNLLFMTLDKGDDK